MKLKKLPHTTVKATYIHEGEEATATEEKIAPKRTTKSKRGRGRGKNK